MFELPSCIEKGLGFLRFFGGIKKPQLNYGSSLKDKTYFLPLVSHVS